MAYIQDPQPMLEKAMASEPAERPGELDAILTRIQNYRDMAGTLRGGAERIADKVTGPVPKPEAEQNQTLPRDPDSKLNAIQNTLDSLDLELSGLAGELERLRVL